METLNLTNDELLTTTRSVRKRLDLERPVEMEVIKECIEIAMQAPTASNSQIWHFVVVTDAEQKEKLAELYRKSMAAYRDSPAAADRLGKDDLEYQRIQDRVLSSAVYLGKHLEEVPVFLIPCLWGRVEAVEGQNAVLYQASAYGSIFPGVWNFMLAARARGLGTCLTTFHLRYEQKAAQILGIPYQKVTQVALIPVAYTQGTNFRPAPRKPLDGILHLDRW
ncbi:MAG: nitroreductase family protein [Chloroflexota bacterium]